MILVTLYGLGSPSKLGCGGLISELWTTILSLWIFDCQNQKRAWGSSIDSKLFNSTDVGTESQRDDMLKIRELTKQPSWWLSKSLDSEKRLTFPGNNYCGGGHGCWWSWPSPKSGMMVREGFSYLHWLSWVLIFCSLLEPVQYLLNRCDSICTKSLSAAIPVNAHVLWRIAYAQS